MKKRLFCLASILFAGDYSVADGMDLGFTTGIGTSYFTSQDGRGNFTFDINVLGLEMARYFENNIGIYGVIFYSKTAKQYSPTSPKNFEVILPIKNDKKSKLTYTNYSESSSSLKLSLGASYRMPYVSLGLGPYLEFQSFVVKYNGNNIVTSPPKKSKKFAADTVVYTNEKDRSLFYPKVAFSPNQILNAESDTIASYGINRRPNLLISKAIKKELHDIDSSDDFDFKEDKYGGTSNLIGGLSVFTKINLYNKKGFNIAILNTAGIGYRLGGTIGADSSFPYPSAISSPKGLYIKSGPLKFIERSQSKNMNRLIASIVNAKIDIDTKKDAANYAIHLQSIKKGLIATLGTKDIAGLIDKKGSNKDKVSNFIKKHTKFIDKKDKHGNNIQNSFDLEVDLSSGAAEAKIYMNRNNTLESSMPASDAANILKNSADQAYMPYLNNFKLFFDISLSIGLSV